MRILAISKISEQTTPEAMRREMLAEIEAIEQLFARGIIVEGYLDASYTKVYLLLECESVKDAEIACSSYPLVRAGMLSFEFTPLLRLPEIEKSIDKGNLWWQVLSAIHRNRVDKSRV